MLDYQTWSALHWACIRKTARYFRVSEQAIARLVAAYHAAGFSWHQSLRMSRSWTYRQLTGEPWPAGKRIGRTR